MGSAEILRLPFIGSSQDDNAEVWLRIVGSEGLVGLRRIVIVIVVRL